MKQDAWSNIKRSEEAGDDVKEGSCFKREFIVFIVYQSDLWHIWGWPEIEMEKVLS